MAYFLTPETLVGNGDAGGGVADILVLCSKGFEARGLSLAAEKQ